MKHCTLVRRAAFLAGLKLEGCVPLPPIVDALFPHALSERYPKALDEKYMLSYFPQPLGGNGSVMGLHYVDLLR